MKKIITIVLFLILSFSTLASAVPNKINLDPPSKTVKVGDVFTVAIYAQIVGVVDTVAIDLITWNGNVIQCLNVTKGNLFEYPLVWLPGDISSGKLTGTIMASNNPIEDKNGIYSILTFKVLKKGDATITLHDFGVARAGVALDTSITGDCYVIVEGYIPPDEPEEPETPENPETPTNPDNPEEPSNPDESSETPTESFEEPDNFSDEMILPISSNNDGSENNSFWLIVIPTVIIIGTVFAVFLILRKRRYKQPKTDEPDDIFV